MKKDDGGKLGTGKAAPELKVFISTKEAKCDECGQDLGRKAWITLVEGRSRCLSRAELDHLEFLMAGDAVLTRRSRKYSPLVAARLRYIREPKFGSPVELAEVRARIFALIGKPFQPV
uniref:Uncharacterized protein n=1 Tax=Candidatus Kentrum sp. FW TaxID=2126338 RepID=A0A450U3Y2_9GAMM|nr:MAG: hypothetical protein BECKFW1821C_GA0114237_11512 [Candidatus Kentron sp. FW]